MARGEGEVGGVGGRGALKCHETKGWMGKVGRYS